MAAVDLTPLKQLSFVILDLDPELSKKNYVMLSALALLLRGI